MTVTYNYSSAPLFPMMPGLGVITPSTISSTNILQISDPELVGERHDEIAQDPAVRVGTAS